MDSLVFCLFVVGFHFMPGVNSYQSLNNTDTGYTFVVFEESQYDTNNWFHARKLCRQDVSPLADLAEIMNDSDVTTVANLLTTSGASNGAYWLGIHNFEIIPTIRLVGSLRTGKTLTFDKWDSGRPKSDDVRCGTVKRDNKWRDEKCSTDTKKYGVLCRFPTQPSIIDPYTGCPPTMVLFDGKCYDFQMTSENVNFTMARGTCEAKPGGGMVIPNSTIMQEFVARYARLSGVSDFWLGITDKEVDGEFKGIYGEVLDYSKWSKDEFDGGRTNKEDCIVIISSADYGWYEDDCSSLHGILCVVDPLAYEGITPQQSASSPPTTDAVSSTASAPGSVGYCKKTRRLLISLTLSLCPLMCWAVCLFM